MTRQISRRRSMETVGPVLWDRPRKFLQSSLPPPLQCLGERAISLPPEGSTTRVNPFRMTPSVVTGEDSSPTNLGYAKRFSIDVPPSPLNSRSKSMLSPRGLPVNGSGGVLRTMNSTSHSTKTKLGGVLRAVDSTSHTTKTRHGNLPFAPLSTSAPSLRPTRKAVLISLTYVHNSQVKSLPSCAKEVSRLYDLLLFNLCFHKENIWVLSDEPRTVPGAVSFTPTRANIDSSLKWLMSGICRGDQLLFYYCGQAALLRGFEKANTRRPEYCIIPADFPSAGAISSGDLSKTLVEGLRDGATLTALFDCRHSEKIMKMPFIHSITRGRRRKFNLEEELEIPVDQLVSPKAVAFGAIWRMGRHRREVEERKKTALNKRNKDALSLFDNGTVICIAASAENEADSPLCIQARNHGILTSSFVSYMKHASGEEETTNYRTMLCEMASWMYSKGELRLPMLHCSHNISPNMKVTLFSE